MNKKRELMLLRALAYYTDREKGQILDFTYRPDDRNIESFPKSQINPFGDFYYLIMPVQKHSFTIVAYPSKSAFTFYR